MTWDEEIESWGFEWIDDYAERARKIVNGKEISIMAFEDWEFEVAWVDPEGHIVESSKEGMEELKKHIDCIEVSMKDDLGKEKGNKSEAKNS